MLEAGAEAGAEAKSGAEARAGADVKAERWMLTLGVRG